MAARSSTTHPKTARTQDTQDTHNTQKPKQAIRRFDIFAEYNRLKGIDKGMDESHAKGYGLWLAKVVASGGGRRATSRHTTSTHAKEGDEQQEASSNTGNQEWHELGGEPQTDALFDREIIQRMGRDFYTTVFAPAIAEAVRQGRSYESMRDSLRKNWTPAR